MRVSTEQPVAGEVKTLLKFRVDLVSRHEMPVEHEHPLSDLGSLGELVKNKASMPA